MRLATIRTSTANGDTTTAARIDGDGTATAIKGYADVGALLHEPEWARIVAHAEGGRLDFTEHHLAPVIPRPGKIICVGLNYAKHIDEMGHDRPDVPTLFIKYPEALIGARDDAEIPEFNSATLDFEGELAVVVGKHARHVREADAERYIAGYTVINDYTQRHFQKRTQQWHQGKSLEKTAGFGPWLDTDWRPGPTLTTTVNGEVMQHAPTDDLVFSPAKLVEFISHLYPLAPGDVIATGTPDGVGHARDPQRYLADGDTVRVEIEGLGHIQNTTRVLPTS
ncbi:Ureidoglycolate lyase [Corynebacterium glaucum]|uniref:fumarylacetoacetate hydrolase family protein n=1 Tax=Corynebacterium glaucum TaxID=187491 RepID=UPI0025B2993D|nr:fumarylacetoacetate hydrolase family protein [Corynebacterium glaucum]WJZ07312.1 Ureidoglycolate lyase [Corynebacterium glaucum]